MTTRLKSKRQRIAAIAALIGAGLAGTALAAQREGDDGPQERAALATAKITLQQAIATAEQSVGGKAIGSGIENQDGRVIYYGVTVDKGVVGYKVLVDMQSGQVLNSAIEDDRQERGHQGGDDRRERPRLTRPAPSTAYRHRWRRNDWEV